MTDHPETTQQHAEVAARVVNEQLMGLLVTVALGILAGAAGILFESQQPDKRRTLLGTFAAMMRLSVWSLDPSMKPPTLLGSILTWMRGR